MCAHSHDNQTLYCSFCGKSHHEVRKLIAASSVYVCDECVALAVGIVAGNETGASSPSGLMWRIVELIHNLPKLRHVSVRGTGSAPPDHTYDVKAVLTGLLDALCAAERGEDPESEVRQHMAVLEQEREVNRRRNREIANKMRQLREQLGQLSTTGSPATEQIADAALD